MQYKQSKKIIIDKRKLDTLIRLNCPDDRILSIIKTGIFEPTQDELLDETLESLIDIKEFQNWGGSRPNAGRKKSKINQDENQLENQDTNQVVDIDKDIDKDKYKDKYKNNIDFNEFEKPMNDWLEYKKSKGQSYKNNKSINLCFEKLKKLSSNNADLAQRIVDDSIANNYAGLFELREKIKSRVIKTLDSGAAGKTPQPPPAQKTTTEKGCRFENSEFFLEDFPTKLPDAYAEHAKQRGFSDADALAEFQKFTSHWIGKTGKDAIKSRRGWLTAWATTWLQNAKKFSGGGFPGELKAAGGGQEPSVMIDEGFNFGDMPEVRQISDRYDLPILDGLQRFLISRFLGRKVKISFISHLARKFADGGGASKVDIGQIKPETGSTASSLTARLPAYQPSLKHH